MKRILLLMLSACIIIFSTFGSSESINIAYAMSNEYLNVSSDDTTESSDDLTIALLNNLVDGKYRKALGMTMDELEQSFGSLDYAVYYDVDPGSGFIFDDMIVNFEDESDFIDAYYDIYSEYMDPDEAKSYIPSGDVCNNVSVPLSVLIDVPTGGFTPDTDLIGKAYELWLDYTFVYRFVIDGMLVTIECDLYDDTKLTENCYVQIDSVDADTYCVSGCENYITLRETPSTSGEAICSVDINASVGKIADAENGFCKVNVWSYNGYVPAKYLHKIVENEYGNYVCMDAAGNEYKPPEDGRKIYENISSQLLGTWETTSDMPVDMVYTFDIDGSMRFGTLENPDIILGTYNVDGNVLLLDAQFRNDNGKYSAISHTDTCTISFDRDVLSITIGTDTRLFNRISPDTDLYSYDYDTDG